MAIMDDGSDTNAAINVGCCCAPDKVEAICVEHGDDAERAAMSRGVPERESNGD